MLSETERDWAVVCKLHYDFTKVRSEKVESNAIVRDCIWQAGVTTPVKLLFITQRNAELCFSDSNKRK